MLAALGFLVYAVIARAAGRSRARDADAGPVGAPNVFGSVADFGKALFTVQLLPFEVTALILMVAVIGVITLGRRPDAVSAAAPAASREVERAMREAILRGGRSD